MYFHCNWNAEFLVFKLGLCPFFLFTSKCAIEKQSSYLVCLSFLFFICHVQNQASNVQKQNQRTQVHRSGWHKRTQEHRSGWHKRTQVHRSGWHKRTQEHTQKWVTQANPGAQKWATPANPRAQKWVTQVTMWPSAAEISGFSDSTGDYLKSV